eukprot:569309-Rhodomonas_salina.1
MARTLARILLCACSAMPRADRLGLGAGRLGITTVLSTDFVRHMMRKGATLTPSLARFLCFFFLF